MVLSASFLRYGVGAFRPGMASALWISVLSGLFSESGCEPFMIKVKAGGNEPLDKILKRFKKKCEKEGLIKDIKRSSFYEKPSERSGAGSAR